MTASSDPRNPVELLAEEFLDRKRRGEQPMLREYLERHPELADEIRDLFPALLMMEDLGEDSGATTGSLAGDGRDPGAAALGVRLKKLGDYRILRAIGRGGMGVVYEAEQESLGRRVALKVLSAAALVDSQRVRRFEREAKAAARLHHSNIVPVFGVGQQDGHHYYVMQFIAGLGLDLVLEDLRRLRQAKGRSSHAAPAPEALDRPELSPVSAARGRFGLTAAEVAHSLMSGRFAGDGPIPLGETVTDPIAGETGAAPRPVDSAVRPAADPSAVALPGSSELSASSDPDRQFYRSVARVGIQVAEALEYANRQGILHRDVKPSNLLLDGHGNVWVTDFGLAKTSDADNLTHTGDILGTIRYMAPERFQGRCDARSDVYSLGLTLYELVALRPGFEASDRHALIERVVHGEPERLKRRVPGVPRDLETIITKASAREPAGRYATAGALAEDLKQFVEDRPIRARRVSAVERLARWCRRNKALAAAIGLAAGALVIAAAMSLFYADRQARHAFELTGANQRIQAALSESNRRLAILNFERGQTAFEKGHVGEGMLWTVESLKRAAEAGAEDWKRVALANLSAWRRQLHELRGVFSPHDRGELRADFSPDGKSILTACTGEVGTVQLWDAATGLPRGQPLAGIFGALSPDGQTILTGGRDGTVRLWDAATGRPRGQPMRHSAAVISVAFSPDGKTIATASTDKTARLWDTDTGRPLGQPMKHPGIVESVAFSPDGKTILTGGADGAARLWDAATGQPLGQPMRHPGVVEAVAFSPDGKMIVTGSWNGTARLWDAATGEPLGSPFKDPEGFRSVAFSPDGRTILTGYQKPSARLLDAATGTQIGHPLEHRGTVYSAVFSPDGRSILTGSRDGMVRLWDGEVGQPIGRVLDYGSLVRSVAFSRDGKTILTGNLDGQVRLWDVASGRRIGPTVELGSTITRIVLSPDGTTILTASPDHRARLWDAASGQQLGQPMEHSGYVFSVEFSPDGKTILTGCEDGKARLWDATGQLLGRSLEHSGHYVYSVAFSPDGKTIVTGCWDKAARLWDASTGRPLGEPIVHDERVGLVKFSADGKTILTGCEDGKARLWNASTRRLLGPPLEQSGAVLAAAFSPDGKTILAGSSDKTVRLWDVATGRPLGPPLELWDDVRSVAFSPDGRSLLAGGSRTARLWDAPAPLPDDVPRVAAWVEAAIGLRLDEQGSIQVLDDSAWLERRGFVEQLGGPPPADPAPRLDPILFGIDPAARGDGWRERGLRDRALAAYAEAIRARPLNQSAWDALARLHVAHGHLDRAATTLSQAIQMMPDDVVLRRYLGATLLASGDRAGWRCSNATLLDRFGGTINPWTANQVARSCALGPEGATDPARTVRLAEAAVHGAGESRKADASCTLGAALYRAGQSDEAIRRLEEAIQPGGEQAAGWAFLAMAHHRLGHPDKCRRWLDRLREHQSSTDLAQFWPELEARLLRSEAEAVILYDPIFPNDPFSQ